MINNYEINSELNEDEHISKPKIFVIEKIFKFTVKNKKPSNKKIIIINNNYNINNITEAPKNNDEDSINNSVRRGSILKLKRDDSKKRDANRNVKFRSKISVKYF